MRDELDGRSITSADTTFSFSPTHGLTNGGMKKIYDSVAVHIRIRTNMDCRRILRSLIPVGDGPGEGAM